ncbi:MAG: hypothetical protein ABIR46_00570 [Candidatus Saccharimonadales bacterium]
MALICPTVTAYSVEDYKDQMDLVASFSSTVHIDLMDGIFAEPRSVSVSDVWWPETVEATIHLMYGKVLHFLPELIALSPSMVIIHAESTDDISSLSSHLGDHGIRTGIALFQTTKVSDATDLISLADHVMLFSGTLGSFGGTADMSLLAKIAQIHDIQPKVEIGWDGGVTIDTASQLSAAGVDVLYVGGAIHRANHPQNAYRALVYQVRD